MASLIYSPHFAMGFPGLRFLHPFDSYRARRAYQELARLYGLPVGGGQSDGEGLCLRQPATPVSDEQLQLVHDPEYLKTLRRSWVVAAAIEVLPFAFMPNAFLRWCLVTPMRWAVAGTLLAAREALRTGLAFSLTGGFHHAKPRRGEGFCLFNDIAYAIQALRQEGQAQRVLYLDLDAHQGNGVCAIYLDDPSVKLFDIYNGDTYPYEEEWARQRLDASFPLECGCDGPLYLGLLQRALPLFLDEHTPADLVIYNAGNDVVRGDRLGGLELSPEDVLQRDTFVIGQVRQRSLPLVFLPSGGYTRDSYLLITRTIQAALAAEKAGYEPMQRRTI
jgi:histone deacetylase 11